MKSLEISEQEASQREDSYEETIRDLTHRLKEAETVPLRLKELYPSCRKRLTDWKMNCLLRRRDTNLSVMSWTGHLLNWLGINFSLPPMAIKNLLALHQTLIDTLSLSAVI